MCDVSYYARLGLGMCGMPGDVNRDIPGALTPWTTAETGRLWRGGGQKVKEKKVIDRKNE